MFYVVALILIAVGVILFFVGRSKGRLKDVMAQTTTSTVESLQAGAHVEVKGHASCDKPLTAPYHDQPCLYYKYQIERREKKSDSDNGSSSYSWRVVDRGNAHVPFYLTDATGSALVNPDKASWDAQRICKREIDPSESMEDGTLKALTQAAIWMTQDRQRITIWAVPADHELYVLGNAEKLSDGSMRLAKGEGKFFISARSEEELTRSLGNQTLGYYIAAAGLSAGGVIVAVLAAAGIIGK